MTRRDFVSTLAMSMVACGCGANYSWRANVPKAMRTVCVPTFRNDSDLTELGIIATRQLLREFQREGTFKIRREGEAALEVQGVVKKTVTNASGYDRRSGLRMAAYNFGAVVEISVIDKRQHKVLIDNRVYNPITTFTAAQDLTTAQRDASGRLADDLARMVVDDMLNLNWSKMINE